MARTLKWLPKFAQTAFFKNRGFLRNPANRTKIALARPIFEQMTSNLLHLKGMSYICVKVAQNSALSFILELKFWSKFKHSKFRDISIFWRVAFQVFQTGHYEIVWPKILLLGSICPKSNIDTTFFFDGCPKAFRIYLDSITNYMRFFKSMGTWYNLCEFLSF